MLTITLDEKAMDRRQAVGQVEFMLKTRKGVWDRLSFARKYALLIVNCETGIEKEIEQMDRILLTRYTPSGLKWIKREAWRMVAQKPQSGLEWIKRDVWRMAAEDRQS